MCIFFFFFSSRRRHTRSLRDWSSDVCSSDLEPRRRQFEVELLHQKGRRPDEKDRGDKVRPQKDCHQEPNGGLAKEIEGGFVRATCRLVGGALDRTLFGSTPLRLL